MHKTTIRALAATAAAAALASTAATAQEPAWAYFEDDSGLVQAGVVSEDGDQLILKCDERGNNTVFAAISTQRRLKPPGSHPQMRNVRMRFDTGAPRVDSWRYFDQTAMAYNARRDRQLVDFLVPLADADMVTLMFYPVDGTEFEVVFNVTGTREAAARVYESCRDTTSPIG